MSSPSPLSDFFQNHKILLAPMAGVTDLPYRSLCFAQGLYAAYTEMVSAKGLCLQPKIAESARRLLVADRDETIALQLFGRDPGYMAEAARRFSDGLLAPDDPGGRGAIPFAIDVNLGCPAPKIVKNGEGSALLREPEQVTAILSALVRAQPLPVTAKIRLGFVRGEDSYLDIARRCEEAGAAAVCLHGRYREQFYAGEADWDAIARLKRTLSIPVIGNGDIRSAADALRRLEETGCDAVLIGRAAQGNPFLFAECRAALEGRSYVQPTRAERIDLALEHARRLEAFAGEETCVREMRKHLAWYTRGMRGSAASRVRINKARSLRELREILGELRSISEI